MDEDNNIEEKSSISALGTVLNYLFSDLKKKSRSFKIGVCTIFLVVSFITLLKAVIEVTPVAFLNLAQTQSGNFDYTFTSDMGNPIRSGDHNFYSTVPWDAEPKKYL